MPARRRTIRALAVLSTLCVVLPGAFVKADPPPTLPGNLVVSRSVYAGVAGTVVVGQALPGGGTAVHDGTYPGVWQNEGPDPSFGVTSPIFLDRYVVAGTALTPVHTLSVPTDRLVTSFPSKSEMALNGGAR